MSLASILLILICMDGLCACAAAQADWDPAMQTAGYVAFGHNNLELVEPSHVPSPQDVATTVTCDITCQFAHDNPDLALCSAAHCPQHTGR